MSRFRKLMHFVGEEKSDSTQIEAVGKSRPKPNPGVRVGTVLGHYQLTREIARGGMGIVYEAYDLHLERRAAVKVMRKDVLSETALTRFCREAAIAAQLRHPNIVGIHEIGEAMVSGEKTLYIAMELVEGKALGAVLAQGKISMGERIRIFEEVTAAVAHAHSKSVVHRDLKPDNILVDPKGRIVLTDFGLACTDRYRTRLTQSHAMIGTPQYMAPEQIEGRVKEISTRSDVFALGTILYEILTNRTPFEGDSIARVFAQIVLHDPVAPRAIHKRIDPDLEAICLKALEKDPRRRYADAGEMLDDLRRSREGRPIRARRLRWYTRFFRWGRRHPKGIGIALVLAILASGAPFLLADRRSRQRIESEAKALRRFDELRAKLSSVNETLRRQDVDHDGAVRRLRPIQTEVDEGIRLAPHLPQGYFLLGWALEMEGRTEEAIVQWRKSLERDPRYATARLQLGSQLIRQAFVASLVSGREQLAHRRQIADPMAREGKEHIEKVLAQGAGWEDESHRDMARAMVAYVNQKWEEAGAIVKEALGRNADSSQTADLYWLQGLLTLDSGKRRAAYDAALIRNSGHLLARFCRGIYRELEGDTQGAVEDYGRVVRMNPRFYLAFHNRAMVFIRQGDFDRAFADWDRVLSLQPRFASAHVGRGEARRRQKNYTAALAELRKASRLAPESAGLHFCFGQVYGAMEEWDQALRSYAQAVACDPTYGDPWYESGLIHSLRGADDSAESAFSQALNLFRHEDQWRAVLGRANARASRGKAEPALEDYARVIEFLQAHRQARDHTEGLAKAFRGRSILRLLRKEDGAARSDLEEAVRVWPEFRDGWMDLGKMAKRREDFDGAEACFLQARRINAKDAEPWHEWAKVQFRKEKFQEAFEGYTEAIRLNGSLEIRYEAHWQRGVILAVRGEQTKALEDYDMAVSIAPDKPEAYLQRGILKSQRNQRTAALLDLERAQSNAPPDWIHRPTLEKALRVLKHDLYHK